MVSNRELIAAQQRFDELKERIKKATDINPTETNFEKKKRIKKSEQDYIAWFEYYFPLYATSPSAPFHKRIANVIIRNPVVNVLFDAFRGSAKSVHAMLGIPLYLALVKREVWFMLLVGENENKAIRLLSDVQANLEFNKRLINDYGNQVQYGSWRDGNFSTHTGIHFHAIGFGQDPRGFRFGEHRPDYIGCDDIDTLKRCNNDRLIREAIDYITGTLWGCFDKGHERFVFCNNLIHKNSILAKLIEIAVTANREAKEHKLSRTFYHFQIKAVIDDDYTPSWTGKYTADYWRSKRANTTYRSWMREYMCTPLTEGAIFSADNIQYGKMLPLSHYEALVIYGDLSYKDAGDYKAFVFVGKKGREFHVIHSFVKQTSRAVCACWLYDLYERRRLEKYNIQYTAEGLFAQDEFISDFDAEGDKRGYYVPIVADKSQKGNKFDRIESMAGHFERLNVWFNEDEKEHAGLIALIDQLLAFEKGSDANDDGPDALHSAIAFLNKATFVDKFDIKTTPRTAYQKNRY
jgi:predicted phage terminase large subunit-like protein